MVKWIRPAQGLLRKIRGKAGGVEDTLDYGWPSGDTTEPNVVFQLLFDELSGNITDEVGSLEFVKNGTISYNQTPTDSAYNGISPGISVPNGTGHYFAYGVGNVASLNMEDGELTVELWYEKAVASGSDYMFSFLDASDADKGYALILRTQAGSESIQFFTKATDGTGVTCTWAVSPATTGDPKHMRIVLNDLATLYINGVSQGTSAGWGVANAAKTYEAHDLTIGAYHTGALSANAKLYEMRISLNDTNDSYYYG